MAAFTLVSFHAHPDDEALLTGGTLARAAAEGHRVVLVVATSGEAGLAGPQTRAGHSPAEVRESELLRSARILGCARVVFLRYPDSGLGPGPADPIGPGHTGFSRLDPSEPADRLAAVLTQEQADALTIYDPAGGYGHPDHRQVHVVGALAAARAGTPVVLEATLDRTLMQWLARLVALIPGGLGALDVGGFATAYSPRALITHQVDVRAQLDAKREALRAHDSQTGSDRGRRSLGLLLRLPRPMLRRLLGREWFVEHGRSPGRPPLDDIFASLRTEPGRIRGLDRSD